jgi:hypothetical protein
MLNLFLGCGRIDIKRRTSSGVKVFIESSGISKF